MSYMLCVYAQVHKNLEGRLVGRHLNSVIIKAEKYNDLLLLIIRIRPEGYNLSSEFCLGPPNFLKWLYTQTCTQTLLLMLLC